MNLKKDDTGYKKFIYKLVRYYSNNSENILIVFASSNSLIINIYFL